MEALGTQVTILEISARHYLAKPASPEQNLSSELASNMAGVLLHLHEILWRARAGEGA